MTITVSPNRTEQWIRTTDRQSGRPLFVAVPSKSQAGKYHLVSSQGCDCVGFQYRQACSHFTAVQTEATRRQSAELEAEYDRAWQRWADLAATEDEIMAHVDADGPLPLSVSCQLNELQHLLSLQERHLNSLQARRQAVAS
jgi:hypothetical protein